MMIDVLTLFPAMIDAVCDASIIGRAQRDGHVSIRTINFRYFAADLRVDDAPYGGGGGMVVQAPPVWDAVDCALETAHVRHGRPRVATSRIVLLCPQGEPLSHARAHMFAQEEHMVYICGHYEGMDERIRTHVATDVVSLGDFVLTGGEIAACAMIDAVTRLRPGVLGNALAAAQDSFVAGRLEYPQYTRPPVVRGVGVPEALLSGHHAHIARWRAREALYRTWTHRPDLLAQQACTTEEMQWIAQWEQSCNRGRETIEG
jgi:tRNA (guanine37-N1)-methyltransferase